MRKRNKWRNRRKKGEGRGGGRKRCRGSGGREIGRGREGDDFPPYFVYYVLHQLDVNFYSFQPDDRK